jgi:hypothetical protein
MLEITDWARDILRKSQAAAARFNPDAKVRLARVGGAVQSQLTDAPEPNDVEIDLGGATLFVQAGLEGLIDIEEPHDRVVLRPAGSTPNERG